MKYCCSSTNDPRNGKVIHNTAVDGWFDNIAEAKYINTLIELVEQKMEVVYSI